MKRKKLGKVLLTGAGPGDPGLLTLKGAEALRAAEVVVYDWLVNPVLLQLAPAAEKIYVGKKGGTSYIQQEEINQILLRRARQGKTVVRLKGGDPFIFGRGGEEAAFLARQHIPFEVIPGVSAGTGVPASLGIPLTDRRFASQVAFVTGHEDPKKEKQAVDWKGLAAFRGTLVSFMGVKNLSDIVRGLLRGGRSRKTPVAVIEWGTFPRERVVTGTLGTILKLSRAVKIESPALTVIGEAVGLRKKLLRSLRRPLEGKTVVVTRAREQASDLVRRLSEEGARVLEFPTIEILPPRSFYEIDREIRKISGRDYDWVVFTSANGVRVFFERVKILGKDSRIFSRVRLAAIGGKTAEALEERGLLADLIPAEFTSRALFEELKKTGEVRGRKFLLVRADIAPPDLKEALEKAGAEVRETEAYRTRRAKKETAGIRAQKIDYVTFTSSSTVRNFFGSLPPKFRRKFRAKFVTIGPVTSRTLRDYGFRPYQEAKVHTIEGMVEALCNGGGN